MVQNLIKLEKIQGIVLAEKIREYRIALVLDYSSQQKDWHYFNSPLMPKLSI